MRRIFDLIFYLKSKLKTISSTNEAIKGIKQQKVEDYYDNETNLYLETYGNIIQAARPISDANFIDYLIETIGFEDRMHVLDAGCGVCGPAVAFANKKDINIDAITLSQKQVLKSKELISKNNLDEKIKVIKGDFNYLEKYYKVETFDIVYFLETLGYSDNTYKILSGASKVLKLGGSIYVKDFFTVPILNEANKIEQKISVKLIKDQYLYQVHDLNNIIKIFRDLGLYVEYIKPIKIIEDFSKASSFEVNNNSHNIYTKVISLPFQLFESLELKFRKVYK